MEILMIVLIGIGVLWALISGLAAIYEGWQYCMILGSSKKFIPHVIGQVQGNWIAVIGIIILSVPVWVILSFVIAIRLKKS